MRLQGAIAACAEAAAARGQGGADSCRRRPATRLSQVQAAVSQVIGGSRMAARQPAQPHGQLPPGTEVLPALSIHIGEFAQGHPFVGAARQPGFGDMAPPGKIFNRPPPSRRLCGLGAIQGDLT